MLSARRSLSHSMLCFPLFRFVHLWKCVRVCVCGLLDPFRCISPSVVERKPTNFPWILVTFQCVKRPQAIFHSALERFHTIRCTGIFISSNSDSILSMYLRARTLTHTPSHQHTKSRKPTSKIETSFWFCFAYTIFDVVEARQQEWMILHSGESKSRNTHGHRHEPNI